LHVHSHATSTPEVPSTYIHPFPSPEPPQNILPLIWERIAKNISVFSCEINAQVILLLPLAILSQEMSALKKEEKEKNKYEEIKRGKCPEPQMKRKSETRGKNGQVSDSRIRGTRYPPKRKEKRRASHSPQEGMYPLERAKSTIRLSSLLSPSSPYTIHSPHMHILI